MPAPPRTTVFPFLNTSRAKPKRGSRYNGGSLTPAFGIAALTPCHVRPGKGFVVALYAEVYSAGFQIEAPTPCASFHAPSFDTRRPKVTLRLEATRHWSCP